MDNQSEQPDLYKGDDTSEHDFASTQREIEHDDMLPSPVVRWSASEFIDHQKSAVWFIGLALATFLISAAVYFGTNRDWFAPFIVVVLAVIFGLTAARRPRVLQYELDNSGLTMGEKHYPYEQFRAFSIVHEGPVETIVLLPVKRWNPPLTIYYAPEDGEQIAETIGGYIPFETHQPGYIDKFLYKIRF